VLRLMLRDALGESEHAPVLDAADGAAGIEDEGSSRAGNSGEGKRKVLANMACARKVKESQRKVGR
jgi:hypothetical protein